MGSVASSKQRKNVRRVNVANTNAIFFGCCGMGSDGLAFNSPQMLTAQESVVSFNNDGTSSLVERLVGTKIPDKLNQENGSSSGERYSFVEEELPIESVVFSNVSYPKYLLDPPISSTASTTSSGTYQTFEPTPLTQVLPQLYLGTEKDAQQAEKLIGLGITHIISIVGGGRYKDFYPKHMYIPLRDNGTSDLLEKLEDSYDFTMESQKYGNKLFVYCQLGQNRSPSFVIGFLMKSRNLSLFEAYSLLKKKRELIHPHKKYIEQLRQLDIELHKVYSTPENFLNIALCSKEGIKIEHLNYSKAESEEFKKSQISHLKDDEDDLSSPSGQQSQERSIDATEYFTICLPDCEDS